ncbi:MAG: subclass B3 metallo-beta-lactamase [Vicinamibacterales bacterium]
MTSRARQAWFRATMVDMPSLPSVVLLSLALAVQVPAALRPDPPKECSNCAGWNRPHAPFRLFGNSYYVGVAGLSAVLVTSEAGHVLLDGGLPQSAALIDANIRALGFRTEDVRLIVVSHTHYDHVGGVAALQRFTGATVAASAAGAKALQHGGPLADDPQYGFGERANSFPAVRDVRVVVDGETLRVGPLAVTAHLTPGHTPGATTWTWRSCEGNRCLDMVYADSLNAVSDDDFKFTAPDITASFRRSIDTVAGLPCDVMVAVHPGFSRLDDRLAKREAGDADAFIDPGACRAYAEAARTSLDERITREKAR